MVVTGFQGGQPIGSLPLAFHAAFFGWLSLILALAGSGYALDSWEGEPMAHMARWLQHAILFGASIIAFARYVSFSRRRPLENLLKALAGLQPTLVPANQEGRWQKGLKAGRFVGLLGMSLAGVIACGLPVSQRVEALAWINGIWYCLALDWLAAQFRYRRLRAKERVKDALDDLRSKKPPKDVAPLQMQSESPWWSKVLVLLAFTGVLGISFERLNAKDGHVVRAELRNCLEATLGDEVFRGEIKTVTQECSQTVLTRFNIRASGVGPARKVVAREKAGIDPLADGLPGNQAWTITANGMLHRER